MNIKTRFEPKPIGIRTHDWEAFDADVDEEDRLVGYGATESEALADLEQEMELHA